MPDDRANPNKRPRCNVCERPVRTCLCSLVKTVSTATEVVIWQHPQEQNHPKGSARLLHMCLPNSRIVVTELSTAAGLGIDPTRCALVYPDKGSPTLAAARSMDQLLLLDGTWRKSRRMFYLNPWLHELARLPLPEVNSRYSIRRAEQRYQLSTFEAAVSALQTVEPASATAPLERVFAAFVGQLMSFRPQQ